MIVNNQNTQAENDGRQEGTDTTTADEEDQTSLFGPGFRGGGAIGALLLTALFALRRR